MRLDWCSFHPRRSDWRAAMSASAPWREVATLAESVRQWANLAAEEPGSARDEPPRIGPSVEG